MQLHAIRTLARELMNDHGLHDWDFAFDRAVRRAGACHSTARKITLSSALMVNWAEPEVRNVILHEVAHALAGHRAGHGPEWRRIARQIGCTGDRCWTPSEDAPRLAAPWVGRCPTCSGEWHRHRRPRGAHCPKCYGNGASALTWRRNVAA